MFAQCYNKIELDLSCFDTKNVTNMKELFFQCQELKSIDLSNFNTENVTNMESMFGECYKLNRLDVSSLIQRKLIICIVCLYILHLNFWIYLLLIFIVI